MAGSGREAAVSREQRSIEPFSQSYIGGIISGEIVAQLPDTRQEERMWMVHYAEVQQIGKRLLGSLSRELMLP